MSLIGDVKEDKTKIAQILADYEKALDDVKSLLLIEGKKLEHANRENTPWQYYFDQKRIELYTLKKYYQGELDRIRSVLFRSFNETSQRDLSERAMEKYIDSEPEYLKRYEIYLEIEELYSRFESVVEAFKTRGYSLNNITKIRVASMEDAII